MKKTLQFIGAQVTGPILCTVLGIGAVLALAVFALPIIIGALLGNWIIGLVIYLAIAVIYLLNKQNNYEASSGISRN